jgi:hypothetical protein
MAIGIYFARARRSKNSAKGKLAKKTSTKVMFHKSLFAKTIIFFFALHCLRSNAWSNNDPSFLGDSGIDVEKARSHIREQNTKRLRWELATTLEQYDRIGNKDVRWDEGARDALNQNAHLLVGEHKTDNGRDEIKAAFQKALAAGCTDPLVGYFGLRLGCYPQKTPPAELAKLYGRVEEKLQASEYPAVRKCYASLRAAEQSFKATKASSHGSPSAESIDSVSALLGRAETQFEKVLRDASANRDSVYDLAENAFLGLARDVPSGRGQVLDPLARFFENNKSTIIGDDAGTGLIEGNFWAQYAWDARTSKWANEVTDEGWKLFTERLQKAQRVLEKAWEKDPTDPRIAVEMMTVELGQHESRERLETWFRRAMDADPDSYEACKKKMLYLEPKWHGSEAEVLGFGHQCLATSNWQSRIPFILLFAHTELARQSDRPRQYWTRSDVWADVQKLYGACLAANPNSIFDRSGYALNAYRAEKWKLASELFTALSDKPDLRALDCSMEEYEQMRRTAAAKAQERLAKP